MSVFIDTAVFMYAGGPEHPLRPPCQALMIEVGAHTIDAVTSAEVIQEILHRYVSIRDQDRGITIARDAMDLMGPVLPVTHSVMARVPPLIERYPGLATRDLVHVATCLDAGVDTLVTTDTAMTRIAEIRCVHPSRYLTAA